MSRRVQLIRHSTGSANTFSGLQGEISVDTTKAELRVHDGLNAGGIPHARADLVNVLGATTIVDGKLVAADKQKLDFLGITQAVDLDTLETEVAIALADIITTENDVIAIEAKTDFITITQSVNLDTLEADVAAAFAELAFITVTQAVNLDTMESDIAANTPAIALNTAKITNANHSGDASGSGTLTLQPAAITGKPALASGLAAADEFLISDAGVLKRLAASVYEAFLTARVQTFSKSIYTAKGADIASEGDTILLPDGNYNDITGDEAVISGATQANPCVITSNIHGFSTGNYITINDVVGMVELNGNTYVITVSDANTFQLDGINSTGFTLYDSGGLANPSINGMTDGILNEVRKFKFDGRVVLRHNIAASGGFSSLFLPQAVDYITEANDELEFTYGGTLWRLTGSSFYSAVAIANGITGAPSILGLDFLTEIILSNDAIAAFTTNIDSTYDEYIFTFIDVVPATDAVRFEAQFSTNGGSSYITTSTYRNGTISVTAVRITGAPGSQLIGSASGEGLSGNASLYNPAGTTQRKRFYSHIAFTRETGDQQKIGEGYENTGLAAINAIKFFFSSGNLESGTIRMYGRRIQ